MILLYLSVLTFFGQVLLDKNFIAISSASKKQEPPSAPASHLLYPVFMTDFPGTGRFRIRGSLRKSAGGRKVLRQSRNRVQMLWKHAVFLEINYKVSNRANQTTEEHRSACPCVFEKDICENSQSDVSPRELWFPHQLILRINIVKRDQGFPALSYLFPCVIHFSSFADRFRICPPYLKAGSVSGLRHLCGSVIFSVSYGWVQNGHCSFFSEQFSHLF